MKRIEPIQPGGDGLQGGAGQAGQAGRAGRSAILAALLASVAFGALATEPKKAPARKKKEPPPAAAPAPADKPLTEAQLEAAGNVFTGEASCEFNQKVVVAAVPGRPGHFTLQHRRATYHLVPEPTTTGAVRLEDYRLGYTWVQIPAKSMLLNSRLGHRVLDECRTAQQPPPQPPEQQPTQPKS